MVDLPARHRFGTYALIFALLAIAFSGLSKGAVWATVDDDSTTTIQDEVWGEVIVNVTIESDLQLREMDIEILSTDYIFEFDEEQEPTEIYRSETYDELAQSSEGNVSSTFEDIDAAGYTAEWMIWIGIGTVLITAILCFCSLALVMPSRPTLWAGGISSVVLLFTPIIWYLNLPSDGVYEQEYLTWVFIGGGSFLINFDPTPSMGVFLSILGGLCSAAMMGMIILYNRAEPTEEIPKWMIADEFTILPKSTLQDLILWDRESFTINFSDIKSQPKKLIMPVIQISMIILFSFALSGTWASYTIGFDDIQPGLGNEDIFFNAEEASMGMGDESIKIPYGMGFDKSWDEMGEVIGQSVTIGTIAIWMLILSLVWRFAVSTGGAQKIPALCQHHRIIDTLLATGGSLLAFVSLLYFMVKSPSSDKLFSDIPNEIIDGGTSFLILSLMILLVPFSIAVFTFGEYGAPVRTLLRSFDIPIPGEEEDVAAATSTSERSEGVGSILQNAFKDQRISGLPWVTISVVILVLFAMGGGGYLAYKIVGSIDDSEGTQTMMLYNLSYDEFGGDIITDSVNVAGGQDVSWTFDQESGPDGFSLVSIFITFDYDETDIDPFCDTLDVALTQPPIMFDDQNSTSLGSADDCSEVNLVLNIERWFEGAQLDGAQVWMDSDEVGDALAYFNEHDGGVGTWEFTIQIEDNGGPLENGESVSMTISPVFASMSIIEVI